MAKKFEYCSIVNSKRRAFAIDSERRGCLTFVLKHGMAVPDYGVLEKPVSLNVVSIDTSINVSLVFPCNIFDPLGSNNRLARGPKSNSEKARLRLHDIAKMWSITSPDGPTLVGSC